MLNRRIANKRISKDLGDSCHLFVAKFLLEWHQRFLGGTKEGMVVTYLATSIVPAGTLCVV